MEHFEKKTDKELIEWILSLHNMINVEECFGTSDLWNIQMIAEELDKRGYSLHEYKTLSIEKIERDPELDKNEDDM